MCPSMHIYLYIVYMYKYIYKYLHDQLQSTLISTSIQEIYNACLSFVLYCRILQECCHYLGYLLS